MKEQIDRIVESDQLSEYSAAIVSVFSVPRVTNQVDAITVLPGLGETWRVKQAINLWEEKYNHSRFLLVAGWNRREASYEELTLERLKQAPYFLKKEAGFHYEPHAEHTKQQADWLVSKIQELDTTSLALVVSPYHLTRAYMTILKSLLDNGIKIPFIPVPANISPEQVIPDVGIKAREMVAGEMQRIGQYQQKGDVASFDELGSYLAWLWEQPILKP